MVERRNFPKKIVDKILEENDYCCMDCGSYLQQGYHKHHINGDSSDISEENCGILCTRCHRLKAGETKHIQLLRSKEAEFKQKLKSGIDEYESAIKRGIAGELSGSALKEIMSGIDKFIKQTWRYYDPVDYPTPLPLEVTKLMDLEAIENEKRIYLEGFKDGARSVKSDNL